MSLPPAFQPFDNEDDDHKRKSEIEDMMRFERPRYFRDEGVQQEYRDILDRQEARRSAAQAEREQAQRAARGPGRFDLALASFLRKRADDGENANSGINPRPQFASLTLPSGVDLPNNDVGAANDPFNSDAILNRAAKASRFNQAGLEERPSASLQPYRAAQAVAPTQNAYRGADANDTSWLFDGGEAEARPIFWRNDETPNRVLKRDRLPLSGPASDLPDAGIGKGDRLPVTRPEAPKSSRPQNTDNGYKLPLGNQDDPARAFEVDTPFRLGGNNRVEQLQLQQAETRKLPIKQTLEDQINYAAQKNGVGIEVHSGGQVSEAKSKFKQTGVRDRIGTRHDDGDAADVDLYVVENGKRRYLDSKNPHDKKIMEGFIRDVVAAGARGIGHGYMSVYADGAITKTRRIHVGGGEPLAWLNPNNSLTRQLERNKQDARTSDLPFVWLEVARLDGVAEREKLLKAGAWPNLTAPLKFVKP